MGGEITVTDATVLRLIHEKVILYFIGPSFPNYFLGRK